LNRAEQKQVLGGMMQDDDPCVFGTNMDNGCLCGKNDDCTSGSCNKLSGHILGICGNE
jgi:hypothetical protein